jgi:hypothetical protein
MAVVCRLRVNKVDPKSYGTQVRLTAVHSPEGFEDDETLKEIRSFFEATPSALLEMTIANQAAEEQFQTNDEFYVTLTRIPTDQTIAAVSRRRYEESQKDKA